MTVRLAPAIEHGPEATAYVTRPAPCGPVYVADSVVPAPPYVSEVDAACAMIVWSARTTTTFEVSVAVVYVAASVGVKVATSVCVPTASTSPTARAVAPSA